MDASGGITAEKVLCRLEDGDTGKCVYLLTCREAGGLRLAVCHDGRTFSSFLTSQILKDMADKIDCDSEEFLMETERALTGKSRDAEHFVYKIVPKSNELQLAWKRHLLHENVKFQLGSVAMKEKVCGDIIVQMLEHTVNQTQHLQHNIAELKKTNVRLASERNVALEQLQQTANVKEEIEKDLYSKFKLVLNEKKNKIRRLMQQLSSQSTATEETVVENEDEKSPTSPPPPTDPAVTTTTTTSSTLLGDTEEIISPPKKRRKREMRGQTKKEPLIPKPPSFSCPQRTSNPTPSVGEDDLFEQL